MRVASIFNGGLGDLLLCNRFTPAILDTFEIDKIDIIRPYINDPSEANDIGNLNFVKNSFSEFYSDIKFCKKNNANSQLDHLQQSCDTLYDFHGSEIYDKVYNFIPDRLYFLKYNELPINKYYNFFTKPHCSINNLQKKDYVYFFPVARENQHELLKFPIDFSKKIVDTLSGKYELICPVSKSNDFLKSYCNEIGIKYYECDLDEMWAFAKNCKAAICCDSGPKLFPMHFDKPVITITGFFDNKVGVPDYRFLVRWLLSKKTILPMNVDPNLLLRLLDFITTNLEQRINLNYH